MAGKKKGGGGGGGNRPSHTTDEYLDLYDYKVVEKQLIDSGKLKVDDIEKESLQLKKEQFPNKRTNKTFSHPERYVLLSTSKEYIQGNSDEYKKCPVTVIANERDGIGPFQLYYKEYKKGFSDGDNYDLIPVFPSDVGYTTEKAINNDQEESPVKKNRPIRKKAKTTYCKKKTTTSPKKAKSPKKTKVAAAPRPPNPPPNPVHVDLVLKRAIQILSTTDILELKGDIHAKLLSILRKCFLAPIVKYFPSTGDPRWGQLREEAKGKIESVCFSLDFNISI